MAAGTASGRVVRCRLFVQELVGPALQHSPIQVRRQRPAPGGDHQPQVQPPMPLPHPVRLAEHAHCPGRAHPPDEGHATRRQLLPYRRHDEARGQLPQPQAPAVLRRRLAPEPWVDVLRIDRLLQSCQLPPQVAWPGVAPVEQPRLEPAVEVLDAAIELRLPGRDEDRPDAEPQAEPDHARQDPRRRPPPAQLAGVVQLDLFGDAEVLPTLPEEPEDLVPAAGGGQPQADGAVEGVLAHPDGVAVALPREVDRPSEIHLMELVGGPGLRAGEFLTRQQWGKADPRRGQAVALQDTLDGASAGQRADVQGLEFGEDGIGPDQAVAGSWRGMRLKPPTDGEDGALQFGRDALGDLVVGPGEVVEALGTGLEIAAPPLVEPELGAAQSRADRLDRATAESESDGALAGGEFVPHGYLRGAAAGGSPRRQRYPEGVCGRGSRRGRSVFNRQKSERCTGGSCSPKLSDALAEIY